MVRNHAITPAQADSAYAQKLTPQKASTADDVKAPGFVHWVAAQLEKTYGGELLQNGGGGAFTSPLAGLDWVARAPGRGGSQPPARHDGRDAAPCRAPT